MAETKDARKERLKREGRWRAFVGRREELKRQGLSPHDANVTAAREFQALPSSSPVMAKPAAKQVIPVKSSSQVFVPVRSHVAVGGGYSGIDDDVLRMFFDLSADILNAIFNEYENEYGEGARKYAEQTFQNWRAGHVKVSGPVIERLVKIVPPYLSFENKYDLIKKLSARHGVRATVNVAISPAGGLDRALNAVMDAIDAIDEHKLPAALRERLLWLSEDDSHAAVALLQQVTKKEAEIKAASVRRELQRLIELARRHVDMAVTGTMAIELPGTTVNVTVRQSAGNDEGQPQRRVQRMVHDSSNSSDEDDKPDDNSEKRELAPIKNTNDLLGHALTQMPPAKQEEIISKAADEALRLQVKQREGQIDSEMAEDKIEIVARKAERLGRNPDVNIDIEAEQRSKHGHVHVRVTSKPPPAPAPQRSAGCTGMVLVTIACAAIGCYLLFDSRSKTVAAPTATQKEAVKKGHEWVNVGRVIDGDTIETTTGEKIRLIGVDTPETVHPQKPVEYFGKEASQFTQKLLDGQRVRLEFDQTRNDRYGRLLAYVYLPDGRCANVEIIRQGFGFALTKYPFKYLDDYREAERDARENKRGLWGRQNSKTDFKNYAARVA